MSKGIWKATMILIGVALMLFACGKAKEEADTVLKAAEKAVSDVRAEAAKFAPDRLKSLEAALNAAKEKFNKGDYKEALTEAQAIPPKAKEVIAAANAKKEELTKEWASLSQEVPEMAESIKGRLDIIAKSKRMPKKITKEKVEKAKPELEAVLKDWAQAEETSKAGNLAEAVAKGKAVKERAAQVLGTLDVPLPGTPK